MVLALVEPYQSLHIYIFTMYFIIISYFSVYPLHIGCGGEGGGRWAGEGRRYCGGVRLFDPAHVPVLLIVGDDLILYM